MVNLDSMSPTSLGPEGNSPGGGSRRPHWQKAPPTQTPPTDPQDALWSAESLRFLSPPPPPFQVLSTMWTPMQGKYLWQFTEVPSVDVSTDALVGVMHVLTHISERIGSSQQREQLVLLGLVVQDLRLRVSVGQGSTSKVNFRSRTVVTHAFSCFNSQLPESVAQCFLTVSPEAPEWICVFPLTLAWFQTGVGRHCSGWRWCKPWQGSEQSRQRSLNGWTPWSRKSAWHSVASHRSHLAPPSGKKMFILAVNKVGQKLKVGGGEATFIMGRNKGETQTNTVCHALNIQNT